MAEGALDGMRVLDLTRGIAGPYAAKLLADYGADVVKIERPGDGDLTRLAGPFPGDTPDPEKSGLFLHLNTNKRSVTLNLRHPRGAGLARRLAAGSDIVIESFRPGALERLGLGYDALSAANPSLVLTSMSNFGQTGPYRDREATDLILWAMSSRMNMLGHAGRAPLKYAGDVGQYFAGAHGAVATVAAALGAGLGGRGQWVDISIHETLTGAVDSRLLFYEYTKEVPHRSTAMPWGFLPAADGYVQFSLAIVAERAWRQLAQLLGRPEFLEDPRYSTAQLRVQHMAELHQAALEWLAVRTKREASEAAQKAGITAAPVLSIEEVANDHHHNARGFFVEIDHPAAGPLRYPGAPFVMGETPMEIRRPAPLLGQHTAEVLGERLGVGAAELAALRAEGAV